MLGRKYYNHRKFKTKLKRIIREDEARKKAKKKTQAQEAVSNVKPNNTIISIDQSIEMQNILFGSIALHDFDEEAPDVGRPMEFSRDNNSLNQSNTNVLAGLNDSRIDP